MKKVFIDCGGHDGCSVRKFRKEIDINGEYHIISFEANKEYSKFYDNFENHQFYNKAVWTYDGHIDFYLDQKKGYGSSLIKEKRTGRLDKENPEKTECVSLSSFIEIESTRYDEIILKLDIEGAEYEVLQDMINTGAIKKVTKLMIEWHYNKVGVSEEVHDSINNELKRLNVEIEEWDAIGY